MTLQSQFLQFNNTISLNFDKKTELKEKRDSIVSSLKMCDKLPSFELYNQGSYAMHTGIEPISRENKRPEYDIDVGLIFNVNKDEIDPYEIKKIIYDKINGRTDYGAEIKKPCVTLTYKKNGEKGFHLDLVSYAYEDKDESNSQLYIAKGKSENDDNKTWEISDPKGLVKYINEECISDPNERDQCRRIVRYLKRWKALKFGKDHAEPASIGITLFVFENFTSVKDDDLSALISIVEKLKNKFSLIGYDKNSTPQYSISYSLPAKLDVDTNRNLFEKMSISQMTMFYDQTEKLLRNLEMVRSEVDLVMQCNKLVKIFGDDFPIAEKKDFSRVQETYIPFSSSSGIL